MLGEDLLYGCLIGYGGFDKLPVSFDPSTGSGQAKLWTGCQCFDLCESLALDVDIVIVGHGVYAHYSYLFHIVEEALHQI